MEKLSKELESALKYANVEIPEHISQNLNKELRAYQSEAIKRFLLQRQSPSTNHLMFNMATGSGKTLVMAALILDCYKRGYRNFVFFVNADALIVGLDDKEYVGRTIPNKAIQYLSYGKPIICIAKGDCQELLKECGGVIFADKDLSSIRNAYQKIISLSDEEKEIMGKANKKYYDDHLTNDVLIKKIEDVLSSSIKN